MIETPEVVTTELQHFAGIRLLVPTSEIRQHMEAGCKEIAAVLTAQGKTASGPWFTHHFRRPSDVFDYEICFPVGEPVAPQRRVTPGVWPTTRVARAVYQGDYGKMGQAWGELRAWMQAQGLAGRETFWEVYLAGPADGAAPADWRTQLNWELE